MAVEPKERKSLLSSQARIQAPWVKVTIGSFIFGVVTRDPAIKDKDDIYTKVNVTYPNYIQRLSITKINGQVNQYTLSIKYPVRPIDDPNFFEKVFSSVSKTRKIIFSYGDSFQPAYVYKDEEAIITKIKQQFDLQNCVIGYTVYAISTAIKGHVGNFTFVNNEPKIPSQEIKAIFFNQKYGLQDIFKGMTRANFDKLVPGGDKEVTLNTKTNISPIDYISYLVSCMIPAGASQTTLNNDIYILTLHDDTVYNGEDEDTLNIHGPYFKVTKTPTNVTQADAYEVDIGFNTATIVTAFSIENDESYSIYYDYSEELYPEKYTRRLNNKGQWEDVYAPTFTSINEQHATFAKDTVWYTKLTKYPINASITIQGLLRPATLMQYLRLNVIFPGGNKHIASGLYIVTKQVDDISEQGYKTTLSLTKIDGDTNMNLNPINSQN